MHGCAPGLSHCYSSTVRLNDFFAFQPKKQSKAKKLVICFSGTAGVTFNPQHQKFLMQFQFLR